MIHYTINTGHSRQSPRSEVADEIIAICQKMLTPGEHKLPNDPRYTLTVPACQHSWAATVRRGKDYPIVIFGVADTEEAAQEIWPQLEGMYLRITDSGPFARANFAAPRMPDTLPWCCAVTIMPDQAMEWLGDLERCMAWAWLDGNV